MPDLATHSTAIKTLAPTLTASGAFTWLITAITGLGGYSWPVAFLGAVCWAWIQPPPAVFSFAHLQKTTAIAVMITFVGMLARQIAFDVGYDYWLIAPLSAFVVGLAFSDKEIKAAIKNTVIKLILSIKLPRLPWSK